MALPRIDAFQKCLEKRNIKFTRVSDMIGVSYKNGKKVNLTFKDGFLSESIVKEPNLKTRLGEYRGKVEVIGSYWDTAVKNYTQTFSKEEGDSINISKTLPNQFKFIETKITHNIPKREYGIFNDPITDNTSKLERTELDYTKRRFKHIVETWTPTKEK